MSRFIIRGGKKLTGEVVVKGSKNAALPLLVSSLLTEDPITLRNVPNIRDVNHVIEIISALGAHVNRQGDTVVIEAKNIDPARLPQDIVGQLRGSILLLGAFLARNRVVALPYPGGDVIGARPIDAHLDAFRQLGAAVTREREQVHIDGAQMKAGEVVLPEFSVTATENVMLAAATLPGTTTIKIAACEPHVSALADLLNQMGATVTGAGTHTISITGSRHLSGADAAVIPDMLEAGLFILLGAVIGDGLTVKSVPIEDLHLFFKKLRDIGVQFVIKGDAVLVQPASLSSFKVQTMPHPAIATDLQAPFSVVATQASGTSLIHDPMYEGRFKHCDELIKMGAAVTVCDPHRVVIEGPTKLHGKHIKSLDIRSGATLILAGLLAEGETIIEDAEIIDRGYEHLMERLQTLGADIRREHDTV